MKKILFPMNFDEPAINAFVYALQLALLTKAEVLTIGAYRVRHPVYNEDPDYPEAAEWAEFEDYHDQLPELQAIVSKYNADHVKITHRLEPGAIVDVIIKTAREERPDLIIMGTCSSIGPLRNWIGTRTQKVISRSTKPVLAIPQMCKYRTIRKILFLTRFDKKHYASLKKVQEIARLFCARIDVVEMALESPEDPTPILSRWRREFDGADIHFHVIDFEPSVENVKKIVKNTDIDLVAVEKHVHSIAVPFLKDLPRELALDASVPLLSLPI